MYASRQQKSDTRKLRRNPIRVLNVVARHLVTRRVRSGRKASLVLNEILLGPVGEAGS